MPGFGARVRGQVRAAALDLGADQEGPAAVRPVLPVSLRPHAGEEPAGRAGARPRQLRLVHAARRRHLVTPFAHRRRHLLPAQDHQRDDLDVPAARDDAEVHAGRLLGGPRRSADPRRHTSCSRPRSRDACSRSTQPTKGTDADGLRAADAERQLLQPPGAQRSAACSSSKRSRCRGTARPARVQGRHRPAATRGTTATTTASRVDVRRLDGSLAERTTFAPSRRIPEVSGLEFAVFAPGPLAPQRSRDVRARPARRPRRHRRDGELLAARRRVDQRAARGARDSARRRRQVRSAHAAQRRAPSRTIETQTVTRYDPIGQMLAPPVTFAARPRRTAEDAGEPRRARSRGTNVSAARSSSRRRYLHRNGSHEAIVDPDPSHGVLTLSSTGESRYWEFEATGRYLASEHRDLTVSYVRSHGTRDLNDYDQFFGNFRNPIIRPNENSLSPTDVPNRIIVRGTLGVAGKWVFYAALRVAHGLPVVGGGRVPGLRRRAQRRRPAADVSRRWTSRWSDRGNSGSTASSPGSRCTTSSPARAIATCRTTSRRRTTGRSTIRSSGRSGSRSGRRSKE